jgi:hypothetical protein
VRRKPGNEHLDGGVGSGGVAGSDVVGELLALAGDKFVGLFALEREDLEGAGGEFVDRDAAFCAGLLAVDAGGLVVVDDLDAGERLGLVLIVDDFDAEGRGRSIRGDTESPARHRPRARLRRQGTPIPANGIRIAASAMAAVNSKEG